MLIIDAFRTTIATALRDRIDTGTTNPSAIIEFYTGAMPAAMGGAITATKLGTLTCANPSGTVANGVLTFAAIAQDNAADAEGIAGWARVLDRDGAEVLYLSVGATGSNADIEMLSTSVVAGGPLRITSAVITVQ